MHNDEDVGTAGGVIVNYAITQVPLGDGVAATGYNFCDVLPASISGRVDRRPSRRTAKPIRIRSRLAGVTIQLLDANGHVIETTTTDAQGQLSVHESHPGRHNTACTSCSRLGIFENDADVGTAGGTVVGKDTVNSVLLGSGVAGLHYDFCDVAAGKHQRPRCHDRHTGLRCRPESAVRSPA